MTSTTEHTFHIPVLGLAFTIDTPIRIGRFGISSVISIVEDRLLEQMRKHHSEKEGIVYEAIPDTDIDHRAKRVTAYLDLVQHVLERQMAAMGREAFEPGTDLVKYFELLPANAPSKVLYAAMLAATGEARGRLQEQLRQRIAPGEINVNIMTKIDNLNWNKEGTEPLPAEYADAMSALRGFASSTLRSCVVFSAGLNPRLFSYLETFPDFFPLPDGSLNKKIVLKVSDYRSACIQGRFLAKKGIWVSEFRIESGLNCGGHAFPTEGHLLGPILEEFRQKRLALAGELFELCNQSLQAKGKCVFPALPGLRISVQGGIGTADEDAFLRDHYNLDATGWGSPFLLVPEATSLDEDTLQKLAQAEQSDYYLSHSSPLGVPFNNFRNSSSESQRLLRMDKNRPGSPCYKKHLSFNTEFTERPICQASRQYQHLKIAELRTLGLPEPEYRKRYDKITEKDCLCEGLAASALLKNDIPVPHKLTAVAVCPGPNLAYFSGVFSLEQIVGHIYGRINLRNTLHRPHMFMNELKMYIDYIKDEIQQVKENLTDKQARYFSDFRSNLLKGIDYYSQLVLFAKEPGSRVRLEFAELGPMKQALENMRMPEPKH